MTLPKQIKIGGITFPVEEVEGLAANKDAFGYISFADNRIYVDKHISLERKISVLVHEIMEGIFGSLEIEVEHDKLTAIACLLHQVMVDNDLTWENNK